MNSYQGALFLFSVFFFTGVSSQSTAGITGVRDSSFNVISEYNKLKKNYPFIEEVKEVHSDSVIEKKNITYCKTGKRKLLLDAFIPSWQGKIKRPAILIIHGGGWRSGNRSLHYPLAERLTLLGYVCFTPEYRLSTEALYPAGVNDIKAAIRWVKAHAAKFNIDTTQIAVAGHSAGGELAAFMGATNGIKRFDGTGSCQTAVSSAIRAVIDIDGILAFIHPESGEGDDSKSTSAATYWFGYSKTDNPAIWIEASPLTHAGKNNPPVLFLNSSVTRMHAGRNDYIDTLRKYGIYTEVHEFENSPHSFCLFAPWFDPTVNYIDVFLKKVFELN